MMNTKLETEAVQFLEQRGCDMSRMSCYAFDQFERTDPKDYIGRLSIRNDYIARFGFAVLTSAAVDFLTHYSPAGLDVIATDPGTGAYCHRDDKKMTHWSEPWTEIERIDGVQAVAKYPDRTLLIVWPDYSDPWAADTLRAFTGSKVLYVGEGDGGCTGSDDFQ